MELLKFKGIVSYELVGKFITDLRKDEWLDITEELKKINSENTVEEITPALEFFEKMGHCKLDFDEKKIKVYSKRKAVTTESVREAIQKVKQ